VGDVDEETQNQQRSLRLPAKQKGNSVEAESRLGYIHEMS
jgi:hypothetical protein